LGVLNYLKIIRTPELTFVRVKDDDWKLFSKAAKANKQTLSEWTRATLRGAVQE